MTAYSRTTSKRKIGVLMGGTSSERAISLRTGDAVADALESRGHDVLRIDLRDEIDKSLRLSKTNFGMDVAFIALHGTMGEDGCIQGMLECLGIPYTGSGVLASALAMDKLKSKELFRLHNVPTPPYYVARASDLTTPERIHELHGSFGFPAIVKPRREGSSVGITKAHNAGELVAGVHRALSVASGSTGDLSGDCLVERFITGAEIQVGILGDRILGAIEIVPNRPFYDFQAKYTPGLAEYFLPARLSPTRLRGVLNLAERAARALDVDGACRVDLLVTEGENEYVLEVNTLPGMTATSLLPKIAQAAGYDFGALCEAIVDMAKLHHASPRVASSPAAAVVTPLNAPRSQPVAASALPTARRASGR